MGANEAIAQQSQAREKEDVKQPEKRETETEKIAQRELVEPQPGVQPGIC